MFNYKILFFNFYIISWKNILFFIKRFLEHVQPDVGSSGITEIPQSPDAGCHTTARVLFTSPYSIPNLYRNHDTHRQASTQQSGSRGGDKYYVDDVVGMVVFPRARHVTNMGTLPCTFLVDDNRLPLKQIRLPGKFNSYFNSLMLSSYKNHLDY